jgi:hypothetical protein
MATVTIIYKSGAKVRVKVDKLTVRKNGSDLKAVDWTSAKPNPLLLGLGEIAAIFEGKA